MKDVRIVQHCSEHAVQWDCGRFGVEGESGNYIMNGMVTMHAVGGFGYLSHVYGRCRVIVRCFTCNMNEEEAFETTAPH